MLDDTCTKFQANPPKSIRTGTSKMCILKVENIGSFSWPSRAVTRGKFFFVVGKNVVLTLFPFDRRFFHVANGEFLSRFDEYRTQ